MGGGSSSLKKVGPSLSLPMPVALCLGWGLVRASLATLTCRSVLSLLCRLCLGNTTVEISWAQLPCHIQSTLSCNRCAASLARAACLNCICSPPVVPSACSHLMLSITIPLSLSLECLFPCSGLPSYFYDLPTFIPT